jgi:signal transduction histidine kinase
MGYWVYIGDMKIRFVVIIYTLVLAIFMGTVLLKFNNEVTNSMDMVELNRNVQAATDALEKGSSIPDIEEKYRCNIIYLSDDEYDTVISNAISSGDIVMDLKLGDTIAGKIVFPRGGSLYRSMKEQWMKRTLLTGGFSLILGYGLMLWIYIRYIHPFKNLNDFAGEIAKGNLDMPLYMQKHNYFGAFTESFDIMRNELKKAKESEYKANISKKELVAELSHDIKTPVSTIKATCEILELKEKDEGNLAKIRIIDEKSDMIDKLISNMFHATLEELKALKIDKKLEPSTLIIPMFEELKFYDNVVMTNDVPQCLVYMDKLRLNQVIDNIINNSYKYAGGEVKVAFSEEEGGISIAIRDFGPGVPEEDMAMITEKFYRGDNAKGKNGSGLGLYLAKLFIEGMDGGFECYNDNGFVAVIHLRKA